MTKAIKLTPDMLKKIIKEEAAKLREEAAADTVVVQDGKPAKAEEVDADEYADAAEQHVDFLKALKIKEAKLLKQLKLVREQRARVVQKALANI